MRTHDSIPNEADQQLRESGKINNIISFNAQGRAGKTTLAKRLVEAKSGSDTESYIYVLSHTLRDNFKQNFYDQLGRSQERLYDQLGRSQERLEVDVLGIPSLPWLVADFHWRIKPLLLNGSIIVFDHYLGDYYADMLPNGYAEKFQSFVKENLAIPHFEHGTHFYLDIDYETYQARSNRPEVEWFTVDEKLFDERRNRYLELCNLEYLTCIDATEDLDTVFEKIRASLA